MTSKPNYLDLLAKRVTGNTRRMARIQVYLDADAITALDEARQELGAERVNASAHPDTPVKMNGSRLQQLKDQVTELEDAVRASTLVVVVQALSDMAELEAQALQDETNAAPYLRRRLELAFVRTETLDGQTVPDIGAEQWAQILGVTAPGELSLWSQRLNRIGGAPDFPTSLKS